MKSKLIRVTTVPISMDKLLEGQLHFLNKYYEVMAVSSNGSELQKAAKREKVSIVPIEIERSINPLKDVVSLWKLYKLFKKEKPTIVHSITPKAGLLSMVAAYFANVSIRMHTFTGLVFPSKNGFLKLLLITMDKVLCFFATNVYPEGEGVKLDLIKSGITAKPLKVLANGNINGIDTTYFNSNHFSEGDSSKLRKELNIQADDFVFIFVGRLVGDKGINELVIAFKRLQNSKLKTQNSKLLLVGPFETDLDPLKKETLQEIKKNTSIISVGYQEDVRPYYSISNALVFPSYREGFPNVVLQAGTMGLPSIVTNISGCNEIIEDGKNGLIIPVKDAELLYQGMKKLWLDKNLRVHLSFNARPMIISRFEQLQVWEALLKECQYLESKLQSNK